MCRVCGGEEDSKEDSRGHTHPPATHKDMDVCRLRATGAQAQRCQRGAGLLLRFMTFGGRRVLFRSSRPVWEHAGVLASLCIGAGAGPTLVMPRCSPPRGHCRIVVRGLGNGNLQRGGGRTRRCTHHVRVCGPDTPTPWGGRPGAPGGAAAARRERGGRRRGRSERPTQRAHEENHTIIAQYIDNYDHKES